MASKFELVEVDGREVKPGKGLAALRSDTEFIRVTMAGLIESHPHDVTITKEAPNYTR